MAQVYDDGVLPIGDQRPRASLHVGKVVSVEQVTSNKLVCILEKGNSEYQYYELKVGMLVDIRLDGPYCKIWGIPERNCEIWGITKIEELDDNRIKITASDINTFLHGEHNKD